MPLRKRIGTAWISNVTFNELITEAKRTFPDETGGVLLGYWSTPFEEVVITHTVGPGPRAVHRRHRFVPDPNYQEEEVARHYEQSGRVHTYLGDWHTHPASGLHLSRQDYRTARRIATSVEARVAVPIMAVLEGPTSWKLAVWRVIPFRVGRWVAHMRARELQPILF